MRIRTALLWAISVAMLLAVVRLGLVINSKAVFNQLAALEQTTGRVASGTVDLVIFGQDYALSANQRASQQWTAVHEQLGAAVGALQGQTIIPMAEVNQLKDDIAELPSLLAVLQEALNPADRTVNRAQVAMLSAQLVSQARQLGETARDMADQVAAARHRQEVREQWYSTVFSVAFFLIVLGVAAIVIRRVLHPLKSVQAASAAIESGDLGARSRYQSRDELGDLARRFDAMAQGLQERTQSLETAQVDLLRIMDAMPSMIGYWDHNLVCRFANHAYLSWFGLDPGSMPGKRMQDLLGHDLMEKNRAYIEGALAGNEQTFEREIPDPAGGRSRHSWARYLPDIRGGAVQGFYVLVFDISDLKYAQQQLHKTHKQLQLRTTQAEQANLAKSQFLANISHEIRTPLNAVLGMHRMLQATHLRPEQSDLLGKADRAGQSLMDIINDVLDLAKIEAGEMSLNKQPFQPRGLFDELMDVHGPVAQAKGLALTLDCAAEVPQWIVGDRFRLRQVLSNLLGNAIKFTSTGGVNLSVLVRQDGPNALIEVTVRDSGVGLTQDAIGRLFKPFVQADVSTSLQFGGTGLGLSIVRNLAQMMGGDVHVTSTLGVGSEFSVTLPLVEADAQSMAQAMRASRPIEVALMCADDEACSALRQGFAALGLTCFRPLAAETGEPDVLLLDAALGGKGAVRLLELVNARKAQGHELPAILIGTDPELASTELQALPHVRRLRKPADMSSVFNAVVEVLASGEGFEDRLIGNTRAIDVGVHWLQGVNVLVVDDSEINLEIAVALLQQQGAQCHTCSNGQEAADWLFAHPDEVDAVLMDVQMPVLDGLAATRLIRSHAAFKSLPVIALTAAALDSERLRATAAGMDDFLTKPLEPLEVVKVLRHKICLRQGKAPLVLLTPAQAEAVPTATPELQAWPEIQGIDKTLAMAYSSNSVVLFNKLLALVQKNYASWGSTWRELASQPGNDISTDLCASLHKLRGSAGMLGATELAAVAEQAESSIQNASVAPMVAVLQVAEVLDRLLAQLNHRDQKHALLEGELPTAFTLTETGRVQLNQLADMLVNRDLDAVDLGETLQRELTALMGHETTQEFMRAMNDLNFDTAQSLLISRLQDKELT